MLLISLAFSTLTAHAQSPAHVEKVSAAEASGSTPAKALVQSTEKPAGWQLFTAPAGDFQILLPANVQRRADNRPGKSSLQFFQHDDDIDYLVAEGTYISPARKEAAQQGFYQEAVNTIDRQLNKKHTALITREESPVKGKGWYGKQISFKTENRDLATVRIVFSSDGDVGYKLLASAGTDNDKVKSFFDSFTVDPAVASKAHLGATGSSSIRNFVSFVWPVSLIVLVAVVVGFIVSIFRNRNREN